MTINLREWVQGIVAEELPRLLGFTEGPSKPKRKPAQARYRCEVCKLGFKSGQALGQHKRHQHKGRKSA